MPLIWCYISGHGYGHAAQVVPVLNALGRLVPDLSAILRTTVPAGFFEPRLDIPWQLKVGQQDIGCIQDGPLKIDVSRTWAAHSVLHSDWQQKIEAEAALIRSAGPACVLSDISHLGIAAGVVRDRAKASMANCMAVVAIIPAAATATPYKPAHQKLI